MEKKQLSGVHLSIVEVVIILFVWYSPLQIAYRLFEGADGRVTAFRFSILSVPLNLRRTHRREYLPTLLKGKGNVRHFTINIIHYKNTDSKLM